MAAEEPGAAGNEDAHLQEGRPMLRYSKPNFFIVAGSRKLRPSTRTGWFIDLRILAQSSSRNSGHSVTSAMQSAPLAASAAVLQRRTSFMRGAAFSAATGS